MSKRRTTAAAAFEACVDELDDSVSTLEHYPQELLALALRAHLVACLLSLQDQGRHDREQTREFLRGLIRDVLRR